MHTPRCHTLLPTYTTTTTHTYRCLRAVPIPTLLGLMPHNWSTPGLWDLPTTSKGQPYGGLPVVDGRVIALPFLEALDAGMRACVYTHIHTYVYVYITSEAKPYLRT